MIQQRIKLESLKELEKYQLIILDSKEPVINNIKKVLMEKHLNQSDLSKLTGICRQNISEIVQGKMTPGVVFALQISKVLGIPVEELFELTPNSWVRIAKINKDSTLYIDLYNLEIISNKIRKEQIYKDKTEYIICNENRCITELEYLKIKEEFFKSKTDGKSNIKWRKKTELLKEFDLICDKRYKKLGVYIIPLSQI